MRQVFVWFFTLPFFVGPAILALQGWEWVKTGTWPTLSLSTTFLYVGRPLPKTDIIVLQKIFDFALDLPISFVAFVIWTAVLWLVLLGLGPRLARSP